MIAQCCGILGVFQRGNLRIIESDQEFSSDDIREEDVKILSNDVIQAIKNEEAIAASDASCKGEHVAGAWMIEDTYNIVSEQNTLWSNKWMQNTAVAAEALIILDLVKTVAQNIGKYDDGLLNMHTDCKVVWEMLTADRLKASQCALDRGSSIRKIISMTNN